MLTTTNLRRVHAEVCLVFNLRRVHAEVCLVFV